MHAIEAAVGEGMQGGFSTLTTTNTRHFIGLWRNFLTRRSENTVGCFGHGHIGMGQVKAHHWAAHDQTRKFYQPDSQTHQALAPERGYQAVPRHSSAFKTVTS